MSRTREIALMVVLALVGLGVSAGQGFELTLWACVFWAAALLVGLVAVLHKEPTVPDRPPAAVRVRYSDRQTLQGVLGPGDYNDVLNIDDAATFTMGPFSPDEVLLFRADTRRSISGPVLDKEYRLGDASMEAHSSPVPGVRITGATIASGSGPMLKFSLSGTRTHEITANDRSFRIVLNSINEKSTADGRRLVEFVFAISEV